MTDLRLETFEQVIPSRVLQRGRRYFDEGRVIALAEMEGGGWLARVLGSEVYEVTLYKDDKGSLAAYCACPYVQGPYCKHIAAVLYALTSEAPEASTAVADLAARTKREPPKARRLRQALNRLSHAELVDLLVQAALEDRRLMLELLARFEAPADDRGHYDRLVREALRIGKDRHGFLDYHGAAQAAAGLRALLARAEGLLAKGQPEKTVLIAQSVLEGAVKALENADDSMGGLGESITWALELLNKAGPLLQGETRRALFEYALKQAQSDLFHGWHWRWDLARLAADLVAMPEERRELFATLDRLKRPEDKVLPWLATFDEEAAAEIMLPLIERQDGEAAALAFIQEHLHLYGFRQRLLDHHMAQGDLQEVKRLCRQWLAEDPAPPPRHRVDYLRTLLKVARLEQDSQETVRLARVLLLETRNLEFYELLKEMTTPETWEGTVQSLLEELGAHGPNIYVRAEILAREGRWEDLLQTVMQGGEHLLGQYHKLLEPRFPQQVSDAYERIVYRTLERTSDRGTYAHAAAYLTRMRRMGFDQRVNAIIDDLIARYPRRRAMREELERVRAR